MSPSPVLRWPWRTCSRTWGLDGRGPYTAAEQNPVRSLSSCSFQLILMALCRKQWGLELEDSWVWELDSSSPAKWSRHLIVACPHHAFANNLAMGDFVRSLLTPEQVCFCV